MKRLLPLLFLLAACGEDGTAGTKVAEECVQSDLIAQCPAGTAPQLDAQARSFCEGSANADFLNQNGAVSGKCFGEGSCQVLCTFPMACKNGVESFTDQGVVCVADEDLAGCGDGVCDAGETPASCAIDCGAVCTPDRERCQGDNREICNAQGRWELVMCAETRRCEEADAGTSCVDR